MYTAVYGIAHRSLCTGTINNGGCSFISYRSVIELPEVLLSYIGIVPGGEGNLRRTVLVEVTVGHGI